MTPRANRLLMVVVFGASAWVVWWHGAHAVALWDLSYVLEHAYRISLGDVPYRDFVLPHAPGTFLIQAAIIRAFGRSLFWPHVYCAVVAGFTAVLTVHIAGRQLDAGGPERAGAAASWIALPVVVLNGYAIVPQPFYDPDCVVLVLLALAAVLFARRGGQPWRHVAAGALLVLPMAVKQNIGLAACVAVHGCLGLSALRATSGERRAWALTLAGSFLAGVAAGLAIQVWIGLPTYYHWTVTFAASRRWPSAALVFSWYERGRTWIAAACAVGSYCLVRRRDAAGWRWGLALALIAAPFIDATHTMWRYGLSARSYVFWGVGAIAGGLAAIADGRARRWPFESMVPLIAIVVAHAAFMSQGLFDSAFAVWPLLLLAVAPLAVRLVDAGAGWRRQASMAVVAAAAGLLLVLGWRHVMGHERLGFVDLAGPLERATLPSIQGLAAPGTYVSDFERLVRRCQDLMPVGDGIVVVPGEDPFFFASGRRPRSPLSFFDDTVTPYGVPEIMRLLQQHDIRWVIVKDPLQLFHKPWTPMPSFVAADLPADYAVFEVLPRYTIFRRRAEAP